jgi:dipeptidyl aminopeptidase/acylaminoacyl peptidase
MRVCWLVLTAFLALPLAAQTKHPFTFEDMMALKRVEEPVPSPDGKWVLFATVNVDLKANTKTPHVWVVPLSSSTAGPSTPQKDSQANPSASLGMTGGSRSGEREIIADQDADRPRWAPDGKRFAFVSTKENGSQVWIADFDGASGTVTAKHRLTNIATEADGELWSPDGKYILFKSDVYPECDGAAAEESACNAEKLDDAKNSKVKAQIFTHLLYRHWNAYKEGKRTHLFVIPVDGCITNHVGPDALVRAGELRAPSAEQSSAGRVGAPAPMRDGEGLSACAMRDLTPGDYDAPVFSLGGQDDYAFSPDGQEICYASNHDPEPAISTNNDLFTVPVNFQVDASSAQVLAATKNITADNKAADETPLYSPDGKYIAYRAQVRPGYESDRWRLILYDRKTGGRSELTKYFDLWIGTFTWNRDSTRVYFAADEAGAGPIYSANSSPEKFMTVMIGPQTEPDEFQRRHEGEEGYWPVLNLSYPAYFDDLTFAPDGNTLLFTKMSISAPNEIYSWGLHPPLKSDPSPRPLTHLNDDVLSRVEMFKDRASIEPFLERFSFTGAHNDKVQGFLVKPPNSDPSKKYPVKFLIHGGPQGAWGDDWSYRWNPELFAANGYVVVMINFHGSTGYGQKFIDAINGDWGGAPFEDLMKGLDYAEQHYPFIDKDRECALGASYGGYMANWILGHTNRFKCIVTHDGTFNNESDWGTTEELWFNEWEFRGTPYTNRELYRKWSPHLFATNFKTPTLVIHGQLDYRLDVSEGFQLFTTLQRLSVPSKMLYFPDEGHWVLKPQNSQLWYKTVNDWVDQWIGK